MANSANSTSISLNKYISSSGYCSRRAADALIDEGRVTVNGQVARKGNRVTDADDVCIDFEPLYPEKKKKKKKKQIYIILNKPVGIECTSNRNIADNIIDFIDHEERIFPIGRLDKESQGLIILTNDGDIVNKILRASNKKEKEYVVEVNKNITKDFIYKMSNGVPVLGQTTAKCEVKKLGKRVFSIVLTQGLNRQIRRMCAHLEFKVKALERVRIMHIHLGDLPIGRWRNLNHVEVTKLLEETGSLIEQ
jgi:23S rRNA pseudouridine2604 synthase